MSPLGYNQNRIKNGIWEYPVLTRFITGQGVFLKQIFLLHPKSCANINHIFQTITNKSDNRLQNNSGKHIYRKTNNGRYITTKI